LDRGERFAVEGRGKDESWSCQQNGCDGGQDIHGWIVVVMDLE
jgi:hypothetical protein